MSQFLRFSIRYFLFTAVTLLLVSITINLPLCLGETKNRTPKYVGSTACKGCHDEEYNSFMTHAKKATSFKSIERLKKGLTEEEIKVCYSCHTTGYAKPGGFISPEKTPHLKNAGCEVCHGPGEFHIKTKNPQDIKRHMTVKDCDVCHTVERINAFRYRPMTHGGAH